MTPARAAPQSAVYLARALLPIPHDPTPAPDDGPPPILGTWRRLYVFVVVWQICLVLLLLYFQRAYS